MLAKDEELSSLNKSGSEKETEINKLCEELQERSRTLDNVRSERESLCDEITSYKSQQEVLNKVTASRLTFICCMKEGFFLVSFFVTLLGIPPSHVSLCPKFLRSLSYFSGTHYQDLLKFGGTDGSLLLPCMVKMMVPSLTY